MEKGTNSRASSGSSYEVFLSFRGLDTRHTFTDFLYRGMVEAGIRVFMDSESLHVGEKIGKLLQAIENCKFYIPIFSTNYASSDWCLRELAHMVECTSRSNGNKEIMPLFLDVEPADVKLKTTLYEQALSKRRKICSEVESWERALTEVGKIIGWNWKKDESQADMIKHVTETVLRKLNVGNKKIVTENLVGVDDRVEAIIKKLDVGSDSVQFLGIHGMGGIGKTTLAKVIFNQLSSHFEYCHFLSDVRETSRCHVRETSRCNGLVNLQKQLLSKFLDSPSILNQIHDTDHGAIMIEKVFRNKKVLIVLDDVDEEKQLKSLAKKVDWFGSGSRIIITTRYQSVLSIRVEATGEAPTHILAHEVFEMECDHALKLFSKHAFRRDSPLDHYIPLSQKIIHTLGNLPLALEIIGSFLNGKSIEIWGDTLNKLKEAPHEEVQESLMITYERLDHAQRQVFLDIACFFANKEKTYPSYMWDACGYYPHNALEVLSLMSLIKIKDDNTFWMHDQVRDLGREIVRKENVDDPCERSRVHDPEVALNILKRKEGSRKIKALSLGFLEYTFPKFGELRGFEAPPIRFHEDIILKHDEFAYLEKLRFFEGYRASFVGDFNNLLFDLKWLSCRDCLSMLKAKNFHPTNLVVLDLSWSNISKKDIDWIKEARKLKVLDLSYCTKLRRTPDLSTLVSLEILILTSCQILESVDWIKAARKLKVLDLSYCHHLRITLDLSTLVSLEILRLANCVLLESIDWIKGARKLKVLDLNYCYYLRRLPDLSTLVSLEILRLHHCHEIKKLPESIGKLQSLIELNLLETNVDHLPDSFSNLKQLTTLKMRDIKGGLTKLPSAIWMVQLLAYRTEFFRSELYCLKMPDSCSQIIGLPSVASLVSNIHKLEMAARDSGRFQDPTWDPLGELENVFAFLYGLGCTQSTLEKRILASPNMRFFLQLPSSLRESLFRELATSPQKYTVTGWWMPIFVGICDSELEKRHLQDCTLTRRLELFRLRERGDSSPNTVRMQATSRDSRPRRIGIPFIPCGCIL